MRAQFPSRAKACPRFSANRRWYSPSSAAPSGCANCSNTKSNSSPPDERNVLYGPGADLDTNALRGQELTVTIALDGTDAGTREISGLVTDIIGPIPVNGGRQLKYRLTLRPWLWLATLNRDTRIFQQQTVVEILDTLLDGYIFPVERRLDIARYPKPEYQVQYNESDFEFFQRLTQE